MLLRFRRLSWRFSKFSISKETCGDCCCCCSVFLALFSSSSMESCLALKDLCRRCWVWLPVEHCGGGVWDLLNCCCCLVDWSSFWRLFTNSIRSSFCKKRKEVNCQIFKELAKTKMSNEGSIFLGERFPCQKHVKRCIKKTL